MGWVLDKFNIQIKWKNQQAPVSLTEQGEKAELNSYFSKQIFRTRA